MILEIAELKIKEGAEQEFARNVATGIAIFRKAKGCEGVELLHSPEAPGEYRLLVRWRTIENHIVDFRGSDDFAQWRNLTAYCFAAPPVIKNWSVAVEASAFDRGDHVNRPHLALQQPCTSHHAQAAFRQ